PVEAQEIETVIADRSGGLGREALAPVRAGDQVSDLDLVASLERLGEESATTDQFPFRPIDRGPEAEAVLDLERDAPFEIAPGLLPRTGARREIPHHLGVGLDRRQVVEVVEGEVAESEPVGLQDER